VKLRELLRKIDLAIRPPQVHGEHGEGNRTIDNVDALASAPTEPLKGFDSAPGPTAPTNWVPSQQDARPH
jgi:hypothetical protein